MLGPAHGITERAGSLAARVLAQRIGNFMQQLWSDPTRLLHYLRRVARVVPLQNLKNTSWILQRWVRMQRVHGLPLRAVRSISRFALPGRGPRVDVLVHPRLVLVFV